MFGQGRFEFFISDLELGFVILSCCPLIRLGFASDLSFMILKDEVLIFPV